MEELIKENQDITLTETEVLEQAQNSVRTISDSLQKSKAYYNALAVNSVINYLKEKNLIHGDFVNMHSSSKMLVEFEIADLQLPNLYLDVRAVFDENMIFIPKKHFEHKLLPDVYLIVKFDEDLRNATLLGVVEPSQINKNNQNEEYYFVNYSALSAPSVLVDMIRNNPNKPQYMISEAGEDAIEKLIMLFMDSDIDSLKLEKLLDYLKNSAVAREKLVEFENFERLSYMALKEFKDLDIENNDFTKYIKTLVATDEFAQFEDKEDDLSALFDNAAAPASAGLFVDEDLTATVAEEPLSVEPVVEDEEDLPLTKAVREAETSGEETEVLEATEEEFEVTEGVSEEMELEEETLAEDAEEELEVEVQEETEPVAEEVPVVDEFDAFEAKDEFDFEDEFSTETEPAAEEAVQAEEVPVDEVLTEVAETEVELDESEETTLELGEAEVLEPVDLEVGEEIAETSLEIGEAEVLEPLALEEDALEPVTVETEGEEVPAVQEALTEEALVEDVEVEEPVIEDVAVEEPAVEEAVVEEAAQALEEEEVSVITDEDIANVSENLMEPIAGEDLELKMEGLDSLGEEFAHDEEALELSDEQIGEISLETEETVIEELEPHADETQELEVEKALDLEGLAPETVIGLSEEVMDVDNLEELGAEPEITEEISASEEVLEDTEELNFEDEADNLGLEPTAEETTFEQLESLEEAKEVATEEVEPSEFDFVESVSDEDVEKAIAQSQMPVEEEKASDTVDLSDLDFISDASGSDDEMSLEELLAIENDLSGEASEDAVPVFRTEEEEEQEAPKTAVAASAEELAMLSASLEEDPEPVLKDNTPQIDEIEEEGGSDFAFAVDSKPLGAGKNMLIPAVALVTVLGLAGAGAWYFLSQKSSSSTSVDISDVGGGGTGFDLADVTPSTPDVAQTPAQPQTGSGTVTDLQVPPALASDENIKPEPITLQKIKKDFSQPNTYLSVSRIVWDIPEYLTYNDDFNSYLQTLGSTIKRNLSTDLLLVNENPIYDRVKVRIQLKDSGKKYSAEIADGCGTKTVDDLVLQSVKSTLNLLQPPVNSLETADEDLYLTIHL